MRWLNVAAWIAAGVGLAAGLAAMLAALEHNPQGALIDRETGKVHSHYALLIFASWFLAVGITTGIVLTLAWGIVQGVRLAAAVALSRIARLFAQGKGPSARAP